MQIGSATTGATQHASGDGRFAKIKQAFEDLGSALESGNLSDAKQALEKLQKSGPKPPGGASNPMGQKLEALGKAIDSGDTKSAQAAFAEIKQAIAQRPAGRPEGPPPGGRPPSGGAGKASGTGGAASSNKVYDKMDANKDGTVSDQEKLAYAASHPEANSTSSTTKIDSDRGLIEAYA